MFVLPHCAQGISVLMLVISLLQYLVQAIRHDDLYPDKKENLEIQEEGLPETPKGVISSKVAPQPLDLTSRELTTAPPPTVPIPPASTLKEKRAARKQVLNNTVSSVPTLPPINQRNLL